MGIYLNGTTAYTLYKSESLKPYFVDKTALLEQLFPFVNEGNNYICITRPRRFGKTVTANMIASFFSKAKRADDIFKTCQISGNREAVKHQNQYSVIHISFNDLPKRGSSYEEYIARIEDRLIKDLRLEYPEVDISEEDAVWDVLNEIYAHDIDARFIFVFDEWDFIFHQDFVTEQNKREYLLFLRNLLKDRPYVLLAYITGILPIAKYSSGSELNMFMEYTMVSEEKFSDSFGFTDAEVDELYHRYEKNTDNRRVSREGLRLWYDGYHTLRGESVYNPRSVVFALLNNNLASYWTSAGPYDEIYYYIEQNIDDVRNDLALMVSGEAVPAKIQEYAATSMSLTTRDEIFSAMVVYGFLNYEKGKVSIPNKELMDKFAAMLQKESSLGHVYRLAHESERMFYATLHGDSKTMNEILAYAHDTEVPLLSYNHETELSAIVNLVYLAARDRYRVEREEKAGLGFVDFLFDPYDKTADCLILELKVDATPEKAIQQIIEKKYAMRFLGKLGEERKYTGRILAVGIGYDKKTKQHACKVQELYLLSRKPRLLEKYQ